MPSLWPTLARVPRELPDSARSSKTIATARSRSSAGCCFRDAMSPNFPRGHSLQETRDGPHVFDAADTATIAATVAASERQPGFSVLAAPDEIRAHGYSLHPPEYQDRTLAPTAADAARAELDALSVDLSLPSYTTGRDAGWPRHRLGSLCDILTGVPHGSLKRAMSR